MAPSIPLQDTTQSQNTTCSNLDQTPDITCQKQFISQLSLFTAKTTDKTFNKRLDLLRCNFPTLHIQTCINTVIKKLSNRSSKSNQLWSTFVHI